MNKYEQQPEYILDLHGYTAYEAEQALKEFFTEGEFSHIRIIVGKGNHSVDGAVLPNVVKAFLNQKNISFRQSKIQDGGAGALEVFL
jgi:DNA-nicking Smr family endonuclease